MRCAVVVFCCGCGVFFFCCCCMLGRGRGRGRGGIRKCSKERGRCQAINKTRCNLDAKYRSHGNCPKRSCKPPQIPKQVRTNNFGASG